jgi:hypothetical protein
MSFLLQEDHVFAKNIFAHQKTQAFEKAWDFMFLETTS